MSTHVSLSVGSSSTWHLPLCRVCPSCQTSSCSLHGTWCCCWSQRRAVCLSHRMSTNMLNLVLIWVVIQSYPCSSTSRESPSCRVTDDRRTRERLSFSYRQPNSLRVAAMSSLCNQEQIAWPSRMHLRPRTCTQDVSGVRTIAVKQKHLCPVSDIEVPKANTLRRPCLTSNLPRNSSMPALSPVRYVGGAIFSLCTSRRWRMRLVFCVLVLRNRGL